MSERPCENLFCCSGKPAAWLARIAAGQFVDHVELCDDCITSAQDDPDVDLVGYRLLNDGTTDRDPRWEWIEIATLGGESRFVRGACCHTEVVPVEADGEVVAHLCLTCDAQLPEEWS